jgi:hypothetical protein
MDKWIAAMQELAFEMLGTPDTQFQRIGMIACGIFAVITAMGIMVMVTHLANRDLWRNIGAIIVTLIVMLATGVAARFYLLDRVPDAFALLVMVGLMIATGVLIAVPLTMLLLRTGYGKAMTCLTGAAVITILMIIMAHYIVRALEVGKGEFKSIGTRRESHDRAVDR